MKLKITEVARKDLDGLQPAVRSRVITRIRDELPPAINTDPTLTLSDGTEARIHDLGNEDPVALYRMYDVDDDGEDEAVILTIIGRDVVSRLIKPSSVGSVLDDSLDADLIPSSSSIRVAHELIAKIKASES